MTSRNEAVLKHKVIKNIGYYNSVKEIGNHEEYLVKVGSFDGLDMPYRITHLAQDKQARIYHGDQELEAKEGMILGKNALLQTNGSEVELTGVDSSILRLTGKSEFCIENTVEGICPVVYGNIYRCNGEDLHRAAHIKVRSSCWTVHINEFIVERKDCKSDYYYSLSKPIDIYEYDERGHRFKIVSLKAFQKCILSFDFNKSMRERYKVEEVFDLTKEDVSYLYENYMANINWKKEEFLIEEKAI